MSTSNDFYGEKYEQLVAAKPIIEAAGYGVPEMYGIPQSTIEEVLNTSSLPALHEADHAEFDVYDIEEKSRSLPTLQIIYEKCQEVWPVRLQAPCCYDLLAGATL